MRRPHVTRAVLLVLLAWSASACSDDKKGDGHDHEHGDAEVQENDAEALKPDAGTQDAAVRLQNCLEKADQLARPPTGQLPCELVAPGLTL